jgi:hypothetical protein
VGAGKNKWVLLKYYGREKEGATKNPYISNKKFFTIFFLQIM